jgi:hypothetical protein
LLPGRVAQLDDLLLFTGFGPKIKPWGKFEPITRFN